MADELKRRRKALRIPKARTHKTGQLCADFNGKTVYFGRADDPESERRYHAHVARWLAEGRKPIEPAAKQGRSGDHGISVAQLAFEFREWADATMRPDGEKSAEYVAIEWATRLFANPNPVGLIPAASFSPRHFHQTRDQLIQERYARSSINRVMHRVKRMFRWGVERELVPLDVWSRLSLIRTLPRGSAGVKERPRVQPVPDAHVEAVLPHMHPMMRALVVVLRRTGARVGEVCQLTPGAIDRSGETWTFKPPRHKTQKLGLDRIIHFGPLARAALEPILAGLADDQFVFRRRIGRNKGRPLEADDVSKYIARMCKKAGVPHWHVHQLRHARLHELRTAGMLDHAQAIGGHATVDQTAWYAQLSMQKAADAAKASG